MFVIKQETHYDNLIKISTTLYISTKCPYSACSCPCYPTIATFFSGWESENLFTLKKTSAQLFPCWDVCSN